MPTIESNDLSVGDALKDFYAVPDYQREYVWEEDQIRQLLDDVRAEQADAPDTDYFVGSIVTCTGAAGRLDLIDGQQRMTTLFVILCAYRDRLQALGETQHAAVDALLATQKVDDQGRETFEVRLDLQYKDAGKLLAGLVERKVPEPKTWTRSMANIMTAYDTATSFYEEQFKDDVNELRKFFGYLNNRVKLIRVRTDSLARALKIFETINDRGVGLDAMDLLKNLLFMKAEKSDFDDLKVGWKTLIDALHGAGEKPLRFLRYVILSAYGEQKLREDELYSWLLKNEAKVGYATDPAGFVDSLNEAATAYLNFMSGRDVNGKPHPAMEAVQLLAGKATRQHMILLLAARDLPEEVFSAVCRDAENLMFAFLVTGQNFREFEVLFPAWAQRLAEIKTLDAYEPFSASTFNKRRQELAERFHREFPAMRVDGFRKFQQRYLVARLTQAVDQAGFGATSQGHVWLSRYCDSAANHIEHITPQTPSDEVRAAFGTGADDPAVIWSVGNLALAEAAINHSLGNKPYSAPDGELVHLRPLKREVYPSSQHLLTRSISQVVEVGKNTAIDRAVSSFKPFNHWDAAAVKQRAEKLTDLAAKVWRVEKPTVVNASSVAETVAV